MYTVVLSKILVHTVDIEYLKPFQYTFSTISIYLALSSPNNLKGLYWPGTYTTFTLPNKM